MEPGEVEVSFEELKRYVRFDDARDGPCLQALGVLAEPHLDRIAAEFYERIREHPGAHAVVRDDDQLRRLRGSLRGWIAAVLAGPWDQAYAERSARVGLFHVRIGLPQAYLHAAMALVRGALVRVAEGAPEREATQAALHRILDLELAIMAGAYDRHHFARIRELHRREEEAAREHGGSEHALAVELARVLVLGLDPQQRVVLFNPQAERTSGLGREEVVGETFLALLDGPEPEIAAAMLAANPEHTVDARLRTRSGGTRLVRWHFARTQASDRIAIFAIGSDITDRTALEDRVRRAEKLAAIGTLAAGLAHEIRNPLNGAQLHLTFLTRALAAQPAEVLDALSVVKGELGRLSNLVTEFLDFARPKPLARRSCSSHDLVSQVAQLLAPQVAAAGARLETELPYAAVNAELDAERVKQVLLNLAINALEAVAGRPDARVTLRLSRRPAHVVFEIEDNGPGIARDLPIFDPFFSTKPKGTGLGLAIAQRIALDHDGSLDVESRPGRTIFRLSFPLGTQGATT